MAKEILFRPFTLVDVASRSDQEIRQRFWSGLMELLLKHIWDRDLVQFFQENVPKLQKLETMGGSELIISIFTYILSSPYVKEEDLMDILTCSLSDETGQRIENGLDRLLRKRAAELNQKALT